MLRLETSELRVYQMSKHAKFIRTIRKFRKLGETLEKWASQSEKFGKCDSAKIDNEEVSEQPEKRVLGIPRKLGHISYAKTSLGNRCENWDH